MDRIEQQWADGREAAYYAGQAATDALDARIERAQESVEADLSAMAADEIIDLCWTHTQLEQALIELFEAVKGANQPSTASEPAKEAATARVIEAAQGLCIGLQMQIGCNIADRIRSGRSS